MSLVLCPGGKARRLSEGYFSDVSEFERVLVDSQGPLRVVLEFVGPAASCVWR
jgi:hypothetical protein